MRLLTINIHSHGSDFEPELYHQKMKALAAFMKEEEIDAAAIQECSEEEDRPVVSGPLPMHWVPAGPDSRVREDNCALVLASAPSYGILVDLDRSEARVRKVQ